MTNPDPLSTPAQPTFDAPAPQVTIRHPAPDAHLPIQSGEHPYREISIGRADPTEAPLPADDEV
ncbi:hypothetical protein E7T06_00430 [Deinococcus sp. Arct2-2]|uniref:hypothetical protein n=1 Tax=Deinococcus sp. Arct2-2 TaxID=2568653 RepID=UPI0010A3410F|nr:hypothetical protein [Deinococcus sp. Arct2-2]THF71874.1 hypothetical protein E7T06_00430 [Deinococcus sp. Arct2-2]